jgi:hypothetical protein
LVLKLDAGKLTGTLTSPAGGLGGRRNNGGAEADGTTDAAPAPAAPPVAMTIEDGKLEGNTISFSVSRPGRGSAGPTIIPYKGTISGKTIMGTYRDLDWTATKQP